MPVLLPDPLAVVVFDRPCLQVLTKVQRAHGLHIEAGPQGVLRQSSLLLAQELRLDSHAMDDGERGGRRTLDFAPAAEDSGLRLGLCEVEETHKLIICLVVGVLVGPE